MKPRRPAGLHNIPTRLPRGFSCWVPEMATRFQRSPLEDDEGFVLRTYKT